MTEAEAEKRRLDPSFWPEEVLEALAYHEAGHAVAMAHFGMVMIHTWIADKRIGAEAENIGVQGVTVADTMVKGPPGVIDSVRHTMANIASGCAPSGSERLGPHWDNYDTLPARYPECFTVGFPPGAAASFKFGREHDMYLAFQLALPIFKHRKFSPAECMLMFALECVNPALSLMQLYAGHVHALAQRLMKDRFLPGKEVHRILCSTSPVMQGCRTDGGLTPELEEKCLIAAERYEQENANSLH